jgi:hypothetical protein
MESWRKSVRKMGGDAVININVGPRTSGGVIKGRGVILNNDPVVSSVVIRWTDEKCQK